MRKLLDGKQFRWWHRLRRLGAALFIAGGGIGATAAIVLLHLLVLVLLVDAPWRMLTRRAVVLSLVVMPLCVGAFAWTWSLMERRYRATLTVLCPGCGYRLEGLSSSCCPECGTRVSSSSVQS